MHSGVGSAKDSRLRSSVPIFIKVVLVLTTSSGSNSTGWAGLVFPKLEG